MSTPKSKKGLGRGFESLIPTDLLDESFDPTASQDHAVSELRSIRLTSISVDPDQPRRQIEQEALEELAASIKEHGVLQPIVVTPFKDGYQIVAGERRFRAAKLAGLDKVPALIRTLNAQHKLEISLIENLQREDLNVVETAMAYLKLRDQFNLSLTQIAQRVGSKSISAVSNTMRILKLPDSAKKALAERLITEGQVRPLIGLEDSVIDEVLPKIIKEEWSSRKVEQFIVNLKTNRSPSEGFMTNAAGGTEHQYQTEIQNIEHRLKAKVAVLTNARGGGRLTIRFKDAKEFARIHRAINRD